MMAIIALLTVAGGCGHAKWLRFWHEQQSGTVVAPGGKAVFLAGIGLRIAIKGGDRFSDYGPDAGLPEPKEGPLTLELTNDGKSRIKIISCLRIVNWYDFSPGESLSAAEILARYTSVSAQNIPQGGLVLQPSASGYLHLSLNGRRLWPLMIEYQIGDTKGWEIVYMFLSHSKSREFR